jgi:ABC-type transport system involved in cytochrome c biogenesis permease component
MNEIAFSATLAVLAAIYFLPTIVSLSRAHRNGLAIFVLNLLLGWTGLGWIAALVWSCTSDTKRATA